LGSRRFDEDLIQEIAQEIWLTLLRNNCRRLRSFRPERGTLQAFLNARAKQEILRRNRQVRNHRQLPVAIDNYEPDRREDDWLVGALLEEFLETLTPRERFFVQSRLFERDSAALDLPFSSASAWKLAQRVRRKLHAFVGLASRPEKIQKTSDRLSGIALGAHE
jgi:hypothetical protein